MLTDLSFICRFLLWTEDCTIGDFLERMSQLLLKLTLGRIDMNRLVLSASDALGWHFFPTGYQSPFDREEVVVMPQEHYDALTNNLCVWGCLDRMVDDVFSLPEMLHDAEVMSHMISELRSIADIFFAKQDLFRVDWRQEKYVAMCSSLKEVRVTLENVAQDPGSSHSDFQLPDPFYKRLIKARIQGYCKLQREGLTHMDHVNEASCLMSLQFRRDRERERERRKRGKGDKLVVVREVRSYQTATKEFLPIPLLSPGPPDPAYFVHRMFLLVSVHVVFGHSQLSQKGRDEIGKLHRQVTTIRNRFA